MEKQPKQKDKILLSNIPIELVAIDGKVYLFDNGVFRKVNKG